MKAFRAFLALGLFVFLSFGLKAQSNINSVNKSELKSNKAPKQTPTSYQTQKEIKATPAPTNPIPTPYPNNSKSTSPYAQTSSKGEAAPKTSSPYKSVLNPKKTKAVENKKKQDYQK